MLLNGIRQFAHSPLVIIGAMLLAGYAASILARRIKLPEITGYILAGLLFGNSLLGLITHENIPQLSIISEIALGIIAFTIGGEFLWKKIKRYESKLILITILEVSGACIAVSVSLFLLGWELPLAMIMGAVAAATAPAATVAIVQSLRIKGEFVDYLYGIVALDDAGAIILFGIMSALAGVLIGTQIDTPSREILLAVREIGFSLLLGACTGAVLHRISYRQRNDAVLSIITFGVILLNAGIATHFHLSALLTNMATGAVLINFSARNEKVFRALQPFAPLIYTLFFVLAGAELDLGILLKTKVLIAGSCYIFARAVGKYGGVFIGATLAKAKPPIRRWLGLSLLPQAGVALGLILVFQNSELSQVLKSDQVAIMVNVILYSVLVNEIIGPVAAKVAIVKGSH